MGVLGSSSRIKHSGQGTFFCPRCNSETRYVDKKVETHFTVLSLRLFPVGGASGYVECQTCKATYNHDVLDYDPHTDAVEFQAHFEKAVLNVMVLMMLADDVVQADEVEVIRNTYQRLTGRGISKDQVRNLARDIAAGGGKLADYLGEVAHDLNPEGKELVIKALCLVASADGTVVSQEQMLLKEAAAALDISKARIEAVIAEL